MRYYLKLNCCICLCLCQVDDLSILQRSNKELMPYINTLLERSNEQGSSVVRPLHHEYVFERFEVSLLTLYFATDIFDRSLLFDISRYPFDSQSKSNDKEFMLGSSLLVSPVLDRVSLFVFLHMTWSLLV